MAVSILGMGHELPPVVRVGGVPRPRVAAPCGASDLALAASVAALDEAGWTAESVQMIVFATMTPDVTFPGSGCFFQDKLGCATVGALDVRGQCAGFLMSLATANDFIEVGKYERILLAAAEVHSSGLDYSDRGITVAGLFADGAAVVALGRASGIATVRSVLCGSDGRHYDRFWCEFPSSRRYPTRITVEDFRAGKHFLRIDRDHVAEFGRAKLPETVRELLAGEDLTTEDVDFFVISHVMADVAEDAARALSIASDRLMIAGAEHGHLTAASLPLALDEARQRGRVGQGARVCLAACGAGYAWGAGMIEFS